MKSSNRKKKRTVAVFISLGDRRMLVREKPSHNLEVFVACRAKEDGVREKVLLSQRRSANLNKPLEDSKVTVTRTSVMRARERDGDRETETERGRQRQRQREEYGGMEAKTAGEEMDNRKITTEGYDWKKKKNNSLH
jgi:hypothetical protein